MLTSEQSIVEFKGGEVFIDRLTQSTHRHYINLAENMLSIYNNGIGKQRCQIHEQVNKLFKDEHDCPSRRIAAFCKLLDDKSTYHIDPCGNAAKLRLQVFSIAADVHPLVIQNDKLFKHSEADVKAQIAKDLKMSWIDIEQNLYSDVREYHRLNEFEGYLNSSNLLSRYNVAQLQAVLYKAKSMTIWANDDFKTILRYAKLARLLNEIKRIEPSKYEITLSGPVSVLHETRRYGVSFARFLPALLACRNWKMAATIITPRKTTAKLLLSNNDGYNSHLPAPDEFDSSVEEIFAEKFGTKRDGWQLIREGEILYDNQKTFIPDFVFRHKDGMEVLMEIVGFWTQAYLDRKRETLRRFHNHNILLAIPESTLKIEGVDIKNVVIYKKTLQVKPVLEALDKWYSN